MHPFEVDGFDFSTKAGFTRTDQEALLKMMNRMVLCTYPIPAASPDPEDACRRIAQANEWQGPAADLIKEAYGKGGLPNAAFSDAFVPPGWLGQPALYKNVVAPSCRACHILRGTGTQAERQSDIDFHTSTKFDGYADRIRAHVIDRGNMPLAKIVFDAFWSSTKPDALATFLEGKGPTARDTSPTAEASVDRRNV